MLYNATAIPICYQAGVRIHLPVRFDVHCEVRRISHEVDLGRVIYQQRLLFACEDFAASLALLAACDNAVFVWNARAVDIQEVELGSL